MSWGAIGNRYDVKNARLLERQLVELTLDDDRGLRRGNVVEPEEDLFGILDLRERLVDQRPEFDVDQLVGAEIGEGDGVGFSA